MTKQDVPQTIEAADIKKPYQWVEKAELQESTEDEQSSTSTQLKIHRSRDLLYQRRLNVQTLQKSFEKKWQNKRCKHERHTLKDITDQLILSTGISQ